MPLIQSWRGMEAVARHLTIKGFIGECYGNLSVFGEFITFYPLQFKQHQHYTTISLPEMTQLIISTLNSRPWSKVNN